MNIMESGSSTLASQFIHQQAASFHPALGAEERLYSNPVTPHYQPSQISLPESDSLADTLWRYHTSKAELDFNVLNCTWDDVLRELKKAKAGVSLSDARGRKFYHKVWRAMGKTGADICIPALAGIPNSLCVLQGGLAVIFTIARKRQEVRQKILTAFEDIPNLIIMATEKAKHLPRDHPQSPQLHNSIRGFQQTLLDKLPILINRLNPETASNEPFRESSKRFLTSLVQRTFSPTRGIEIDELIDVIRNDAEKVKIYAEAVMDSIIVATNRTLHDNFKATQNINTKIEEILRYQRDIKLTMDSVSGGNSLHNFLMDFLNRPGSTENGTPRVPEQPFPDHQVTTQLTADQLLQIMNVNHLDALQIEKHVVRRAHSMGSDSMSQAMGMFQATQIQQLLRSSESRVVLVSGYMDRAQCDKVSPITTACAALIQALRCSPERNLVLAFFCGAHSSSEDDLFGPQGIMRSFVAQLVLILVQNRCISGCERIGFANLNENFEQLSVQNFCQIFHQLVQLVPSTMVVHCIVDGISFYEQSELRDDYHIMVDCLFTNVSSSRNTFKLLFTTPTRSQLSSIERVQHVSLRNVRVKCRANLEAMLQIASRDITMQD